LAGSSAIRAATGFGSQSEVSGAGTCEPLTGSCPGIIDEARPARGHARLAIVELENTSLTHEGHVPGVQGTLSRLLHSPHAQRCQYCPSLWRQSD
jgi:hypothetical protein